MRHLCSIAMWMLIAMQAAAQPVVPTFNVTTYAEVAHPAGIALTLYEPLKLLIGRAPDDPGTVMIVPPGGSVAPFSLTPLRSPRYVAVDPGYLTHPSGTTLFVSSPVGSSAGVGRLSSVRFDGFVSIATESPLLSGAAQMVMTYADPALFVVVGSNGSIARYDRFGSLSIVVVTSPGVAVDSLARAWVGGECLAVGRANGTVALYRAVGLALVDASYAEGVPGPVIVDAPLSVADSIWGHDVYVMTGGGELRRYSAHGVYTVVGTGFGPVADMEFGFDDALYVSSNVEGKVYRVSCLDVSLVSSVASQGYWYLCPGQDLVLTADAHAAEPITYQWQVWDWVEGEGMGWRDASGSLLVDGAEAGVFAGGTSATLTFTPAPFVGNQAIPVNWTRQVRCIVSTACGSKELSTWVGLQTADIGAQGGVYGHDGRYDNNDFVQLIDLFFAHDPRVDVGVGGGAPGSDGAFDNNDFVFFIDLFFRPC